MNRVCSLRPALSRCVTAWSMTKVFNYIKYKPTLPSCNLKTVSHGLAILICLTTGQRDQTIQCLNLNYVTILNEKLILIVTFEHISHLVLAFQLLTLSR